jgi:mannose-6-phosphate isomerase-like protein (cupin superfamily)
VAEQMRQIGVEPNAILLEPMGRNTAPAVTVAALQATANGEDPLLLVLAADHLIRDAAQFRQAINAGRKPAEEGRLVTFGIVPTAPETGYGYIEASEPFSLGGPVHVPIKRFVEKPDQATAEQFLATGRFTWNSGMFLFRASAMLAEMERLAPEVVKQLEATGSPEGKAHRKIYRPWGHYTGVVEDSRWQVKRISVKPGASLSLQMHHHRAEHWVVVKGTALVERDGEEQLVGENQSTYIPMGCKHRLSNPGRIPVELIEIQSGTYLGEDDIVRFQDRYGQTNARIEWMHL